MSSQDNSITQAGITLSIVVNNAQSGERVSVTLTQRDLPVAWSSGPNFARSGGLNCAHLAGARYR
jgi:hypothetical protein